MRIFLGIVLLFAITACHAAEVKPPELVGATNDASDRNAPAHFRFDSLDSRELSSEAFRGKPAVLLFVTTYDMASQAQVNYLAAMARHDADEIHYGLVALEEPADRELVEVYALHFKIEFPVALADAETIAGGGPLGDVHVIPTTIVLDRDGRIAWKHVGLVKSEEIRAALKGL